MREIYAVCFRFQAYNIVKNKFGLEINIKFRL